MTVTAIIPAYNEEKTIVSVLTILKEIPLLKQIIVVSDGSSDLTVERARQCEVEVIALEKNLGKGGAMVVGMEQAKENVLLFLDADLIGITQDHILALIRPVLEHQDVMTVGLFEDGRLSTDMAQVIAPYLSGQRCLHKNWLEGMSSTLEHTGFGIEAALTQLANQKHLKILYVMLPQLTHVMKEEKLGLVKGFAYRLKMYWEIAKNVRTGG